MVKNCLAVIGGIVVVLYFLGAIGAGNFVLRYDVNPILCIRGV